MMTISNERLFIKPFATNQRLTKCFAMKSTCAQHKQSNHIKAAFKEQEETVAALLAIKSHSEYFSKAEQEPEVVSKSEGKLFLRQVNGAGTESPDL